MGGQYSTLIILVVFLGLMYFLMLRPQQKQQKKHRDMMGALKKGDHVVTIGRLHGVIDEINQADKTVTLDCDGIYLVFDLRAISSVTSQAPAAVTAPVAASEAAAKEAPAADASAAAEPASEAAASDAPADDADDSEATK
ncbi:preprotein translocase subunit YajC [Levilactobacillus koreensis JCM 16448]|uniref:Preprotein translocase subunit YajC n=1 Tax=Levilactobacillus koreensis TaxID=637971 RepID=A0AAC8UT71_9LACO|nr:preprotein translocase subunit YajC [Levilactobacillus koreensis]AKP63650.1 preprotein translocase subunit YajC [Levilactobacillus koreensis]KRK89349.1 preprotein translocase subunit YajC [Levilactobacillus koreensis JCM 16448]